MQAVESKPICHLRMHARADREGWAILALRPYNPEGISFIHTALLSPERNRWTIDGKYTVEFSAAADRHHVSDYRSGDVHIHLSDLADEFSGECDVGMVTAAAMFKLEPNQTRELLFKIPMESGGKIHRLQLLPGSKACRVIAAWRFPIHASNRCMRRPCER